MFKPYITLFRPYQYVKNLFIFLPIFFGLKALDFLIVQDLIITFLDFP